MDLNSMLYFFQFVVQASWGEVDKKNKTLQNNPTPKPSPNQQTKSKPNLNQSDHDGVICKFHYGVGCLDGCAAMCKYGEEDWAEDAALRCSYVQGESKLMAVQTSRNAVLDV